jgi:ribosomal protein L32
MTLGGVLVGLAIMVLAAAIVLRPFREGEEPLDPRPDAHERQSLERALTALRDLDFDHGLGKISQEDYQPARARLLAQAAEAMRYPSDERLGKDLEARVLHFRRELTQSRPSNRCPACGARMLPRDLFCTHCGRAQAAHCPSCGAAFGREDTFCSRCGTRLEAKVLEAS